jgi:hypothetical protein
MDWRDGLEGWIGGKDWRDGLEGWIGGMNWRDELEGWIGKFSRKTKMIFVRIFAKIYFLPNSSKYILHVLYTQ